MITVGSRLIEPDAPHPACFQPEDDASPDHWMTLQHGLTFHELQRELATTGWTFFFLAGAIKTNDGKIALGTMQQKFCLRAAVRVHCHWEP